MFTGIIVETGELAAVETFGQDKRMRFRVSTELVGEIQVGDSVAVNGICLTAIEIGGDSFSADLSIETLQCTLAGSWQVQQQLNFELAMLASTRFGGHMVSGHVDGIAEVTSVEADQRSVRMKFIAPSNLKHFIAAKGSVTIDGVSLTVNQVDDCEFEVNLVPHTLIVTSLNELKPGSQVNLEVDLLARYLERLLAARE